MRDRPVAYYKLNAAPPFTDVSGYGRAGTGVNYTSGTGLGNGLNASTSLDSDSTMTLASPVFVRTKESDSFSLEVILHPTSTTGTQKVLCHSGQTDGITVTDTVISFSTVYSTAGTAKVSFDIQIPRRVHVVAVHTRIRNSLYVDGVMVAAIDLTDAQIADQYIVTDGNLYGGGTAGTKKVSVNGVGIYARALQDTDILEHYEELNRAVVAPYTAFGGIEVPAYLDKVDIFLTQTWKDREQWENGVTNNVNVDNDNLTPAQANGVSLAGSWIGSVPLSIADTPTIAGVNISWEGVGSIVETSLDGVTWFTAVRGNNVASVPSGTNPENKVLLVRISFPGGITGDESYLDNLTVYGVRSQVTGTFSGRTITLPAGGYYQFDREPNELRDDWGVSLTSGNLTISADPEATTISAVTVWINHRSSTTSNLTGSVTSNGTAFVAWKVNEWEMAHFNFASPTAGVLSIGGNQEVAGMIIYTRTLTAAEITRLYQSSIGVVATRFDDSSAIGIVESTNASEIYAHDWSIASAG